MQIIEYVIYNRVIHQAESFYHPSHYGYRRLRGTDAHLDSLVGAMHTELRAKNHIYLSGLDIKGAFGTLPHKVIHHVLQETGMDTRCAQLIHKWTTSR